jgi:hypothetical protein
MSYPISKTRSSKQAVADINQARKDLHKIFADNGAVLFDPVTIDELVLKPALNEGDNFVLKAESRWPISDNGLAKPFSWPIEILTEQVKEVQSDIGNQVTARDFKLIDNARFTVVYRPNYCGFSTGVNAEVIYSASQGRGIYVYDPPEDADNTQPKTNPFTQKTTNSVDYSSFLQLIMKTLPKMK